jgi:membrane protein required for colicin V production
LVIDILVLVAVIAAVINGLRKGLIIAVFSILAFIVGIAAALKLSAVAANWIGNSTNISSKYLPVLGFIVVFIAVVLLVRIGAKMIEGMVKFALLGWLNKIGGIIFYIILYIVFVSTFLFFAIQLQFFSQEEINSSQTYKWIAPWGPWVIDSIGTVIPWFKNMFKDLELFFSTFAKKASS